MTKYLLLLALMVPMFHVEQSQAGRKRFEGKIQCYLIRGEVQGQFIHGYAYMSKEAADLLRAPGLNVDRRSDRACDAFLGNDEDD
jgi:hypothetical protein